MAHRVLTETAVSISEHKKNPMATVAAGEGMAVAVLNRNEPAFYCVPARARAYEELMDLGSPVRNMADTHGLVRAASVTRSGL
jgi:antitoxin StbD